MLPKVFSPHTMSVPQCAAQLIVCAVQQRIGSRRVNDRASPPWRM